ncbi:MAG: HD domain-containing protein [Bacteriovoracaceae bacterium]
MTTSKFTVKTSMKKLEQILQIGQILNLSLTEKNGHKQAVNKIKELLNVKHCFIFRVDKKSNKIYPDVSCSLIKSNQQLNIDQKSFLGSCAHYKAVINIDNIYNDLRSKGDYKELMALNLNKMLLSPLVSRGEVLGILFLADPKDESFSLEDFYIVDLLCGQLTVSIENLNLLDENRKQFIQVVEALAEAISKKDKYTGGHTKRVGHFAEMIAEELKLNQNEIVDLNLAAILHDVGKIGIEDKILKKSAPLTKEEFEIMKEHPRIGFEILGHIDSLKNAIEGMRYHHERPDGTGYPYKLKGDEIPLIAQIISVADTFDAMISTRPYRKGIDPMLAFDEIIKFRGTQFSEVVVDAFETAFKKSTMYKPELKKKAS